MNQHPGEVPGAADAAPGAPHPQWGMCYVADTCTLDPQCEFYSGHRHAEDDEQYRFNLAGVRKMTAYMQVSTELLMDEGVIPDTRQHKPMSLRRRFWWWRHNMRGKTARLAYRAIAGDWPRGEDD